MKGVQVILEMERQQRVHARAAPRAEPEDVPLPEPEEIALPEPESFTAPKTAGRKAAAANPMEELALAVPEVTDVVSLNAE